MLCVIYNLKRVIKLSLCSRRPRGYSQNRVIRLSPQGDRKLKLLPREIVTFLRVSMRIPNSFHPSSKKQNCFSPSSLCAVCREGGIHPLSTKQRPSIVSHSLPLLPENFLLGFVYIIPEVKSG